MTQDANNLIWIDLEMTGLDPAHDQIIEIATIVTNSHLEILEEGPVFAIYQPDYILDAMDEWNTKQHNGSGLVARVKASDVSLVDAERATISFINKFVPKKRSPICGNSICQDRRFLARLMPELENYFHYRNLDVSTLKELVSRWAPNLAGGFSKNSSHLALNDIRDSIDELKYYRQHFIKLPE